jgi:hypothetical protein
MTIEIPVWLLWALGVAVGVPAVVLIIWFAWFGYVVASSLKGGIWR